MGPGLVGGAGLFAAFGAVAVDEEGWGPRGCVVDVATGAASGGHDIDIMIYFFWGGESAKAI